MPLSGFRGWYLRHGLNTSVPNDYFIFILASLRQLARLLGRSGQERTRVRRPFTPTTATTTSVLCGGCPARAAPSRPRRRSQGTAEGAFRAHAGPYTGGAARLPTRGILRRCQNLPTLANHPGGRILFLVSARRPLAASS